MKYFSLVWSALRRRPVRSILTILSVMVAFSLFGLMIGLNATLDQVEQRAHADRIWTNARFGDSVPITVARQIAALPGVTHATAMSFVGGYVGDPKNRVFIEMADNVFPRVYPDRPITAQQFGIMRQNRDGLLMSQKQADKWHKKVGDLFTLISPDLARADGGKNWTFKVVGIIGDMTAWPEGYNLGNYDYYDTSLPPADQGKITEVDFIVSDPAHAEATADRVDQIFANSANPTQSQTEKSVFSPANDFGGLDVGAVTRKVALVGLLMLLFLTASVITQSVRERFAEFATLRTLGFSDSAVIALVVTEAALPCLVGAFCGVAMAEGLAYELPKLMPPDFGLPLPTMSGAVFLWAALWAFVMALGSTALPALRLARMDIAAALSGRG